MKRRHCEGCDEWKPGSQFKAPNSKRCSACNAKTLAHAKEREKRIEFSEQASARLAEAIAAWHGEAALTAQTLHKHCARATLRRHILRGAM